MQFIQLSVKKYLNTLYMLNINHVANNNILLFLVRKIKQLHSLNLKENTFLRFRVLKLKLLTFIHIMIRMRTSNTKNKLSLRENISFLLYTAILVVLSYILQYKIGSSVMLLYL